MPTERASVEQQIKILDEVLARYARTDEPVLPESIAEIHASDDINRRVLSYFVAIGFLDKLYGGYVPNAGPGSLSDPSVFQALIDAIMDTREAKAVDAIVYGKGRVDSQELAKAVVRRLKASPKAETRITTLVRLMIRLGMLSETNGYATPKGEEITVQLVPGADKVNHEDTRLLDVDQYVRLSFWNQCSQLPTHASITRLVHSLPATPPEKAEPVMKAIVAGVGVWLGFTPQPWNGPREDRAKKSNSLQRLDYGPEGDDIALYSLRPVAVGGTTYEGFVIAAELKRGQADKKSVTQAAAFRDRLMQVYSGQLLVIPLVISMSERFTEQIARTYAATSAVMHLPLHILEALFHEQSKRFFDGAVLIHPGDVLRALLSTRQFGKVEVALKDWMGVLSDGGE